MNELNVFAPTRPHTTQKIVLDALDNGQRFVQLRAGRKWRKTSLIISWLFEKAFKTGLVCPYVAPSRVQAKNIAWNDHVTRVLTELKSKKCPYKTNETELSISLPNGGKVQLHGVENKESLRGISNWGAFAGDEYDDWDEDIWPTIIRPNLIVHKAQAILAGTPKGFRNLYNLEQKEEFRPFHFTSHDNPDIDINELDALEKEYRLMGESYYRQEILAEYEKPVGTVYDEWPTQNFKDVPYDQFLPLYLTIDFGVNDPTAVIWIQKNGGETRVIDYFEQSDISIQEVIQLINSKPYKKPDMITGDPAGKARSIVTNTSPVEEFARSGMYVTTKDGVRIEDQIRITHKYIRGLFIDKRADRLRECILNYRYPEKATSLLNQSNENPIHDQFSHGMRALEYFFVNIDSSIVNSSQEPPSRWGKDAWRIGK